MIRNRAAEVSRYLPLAVARESSVALVHETVHERKVIGVVTQRDPAIDEPVESDLYRLGTLTHIRKMFKFPDGSLRLVVQGVQRFRVMQVIQYRPFIKARIELIEDAVPAEEEVEVRALAQSSLGLFQRVVELSPTLSDDLSALAVNIQEPARLGDFVAGQLPSLNTSQRQEFLDTIDVRARLDRINKILVNDLEAPSRAIIDSKEERVAQLIVRKLGSEVVAELRKRAARRGRSMEAEHREILREALRPGRGTKSLKELLLAMPAAGEDSDFARLRQKPRRVRL